MNFNPIHIGVAGLIALALVVSLAAGAGYFKGQHDTYKEARDEVENYRDQAREALKEAENKIAEKEKVHEKEVSDLRASYVGELAASRADDRATIAALRDGNKRLLTQVQSSGNSCPKGNGAAAAPAGANGTTTAELAPEVAASLYSIAVDGDAAIMQLTYLQEWAKKAVKLCGKGVPK